MGIIADLFFKGFNDGRERARNNSYRKKDMESSVIKLVEPSTEKIVELHVNTTATPYPNLFMDELTNYAKYCESSLGATFEVIGNTVKITFPNEIVAESARKAWRN